MAGSPGPTRVQWLRLRRSGLVKPFGEPQETARALLGVQAQMMSAAELAFWNRTRGCSRADLEHARLNERSLVRFWGQRNTVHVYASEDWPFLHSALAERQTMMHRRLAQAGALAEYRRVVKRTAKKLAGRSLTYADVRSTRLQELADKWAVSYVVFMELVRDGIACHGPEVGSSSTFVHRENWLPRLEWAPPPPGEALPRLALRYLACYGPAEARDLAFWYGTTVTNAERWLSAAGDRCRRMTVRGRTLWLRAEDGRALHVDPPPKSRWPVKLLHRFDPLLLATKDKSWLVDEAHYKKVWRAAAHVEPVLLVGGRIVGTWRYDRRARGLEVHIRPFAPLSRPVRVKVEDEAEGVARFLDLGLASLSFDV